MNLSIRALQTNANFQFELLKIYSRDMEESIKSQATLFANRVKELAAKYEGEDQTMVWDENRERYFQLHNIYPNLLRSSILSSALTELEMVIGKIRKELRENTELNIVSIHNKKLKGAEIQKALQSIFNGISINPQLNLKCWKQLQFIIEVRNRVIHSGGQVHPVEYKDLYVMIMGIEDMDDRHIGLSHYHEVEFLEEFPAFVLDVCNSILNQTVEELFKYQEGKGALK
ncbi:hypothetical protein MKY95_19045 [Paenibacillus sp. FSL P4-0176]|uniref:hypothetical protein n=1 Tax=Paenibacillus sp. FSL P4-0176 TaxID=2921631 RepID=UPI0030D60530